MRLEYAMAVMVALVASLFDLHSRRIPNALTFGAAVVAFVVAAVTGGLAGLGSSAGGWAVGLALWLPIYALGGMGAGDVKLLAAIGAWLGVVDVFHAALFTAIAGGVLAVIVAVARGRMRQTYWNLQMLVLHWRVAGLTAEPVLTLETATGPRLAYAVPTLIGTVAAIWLR